MNSGDEIVDNSPQGRYVRFRSTLGSGAYKTVYKAYDTKEGIEVAWNQVDIAALPKGEKNRIIQEVKLLQTLEHKNIINFHGSWVNREKQQVVFITEIVTSGNLSSFIKRVQVVRWKIVKRWCRQILEGLKYLHSHDPPIIHRDLKCDNIFINGSTGDLRIGDLGLSTQMSVGQNAQSVLGTPEFMAPELYDENYDEKVDIYAFGMCVLEMITKEIPYSECANPAQIYKKVIAGIRPEALKRVSSTEAHDFIELCLSRGGGEKEVSAAELLDHPFLSSTENDDEEVLAYPREDNIIVEEDEMQEEEFERHVTVDAAVKAFNRARSDPSVKAVMEKHWYPESDQQSGGPSQSKEDRSVAEGGTGVPMENHSPLYDGVDAEKILEAMPGVEPSTRSTQMVIMSGRGEQLVDAGPATALGNATDSVESSQQMKAIAECAAEDESELESDRQTGSEVGKKQSASSRPSSRAPSRPASRPGTPTRDDGIKEYPTRRGPRHEIKSQPDPESENSIILNLRLQVEGKSKEIKFSFNLYTDSTHEVACELAYDVRIPEGEVEDIANSIAYLVTESKTKFLDNVDVDVWEEAPEPHPFNYRPAGRVAIKANNGPAVDASQPLASNPVDYTAAQGQSYSAAGVVQGHSTGSNHALSPGRGVSATFPSGLSGGTSGSMSPGRPRHPQMERVSRQSVDSQRTEMAIEAANALMAGMSGGLERDRTVDRDSLARLREEGQETLDGMGDLEGGVSREDVIDDLEYLRKKKEYEKQLHVTKSAFDQRDMSLEMAMKHEEEKHLKEMERHKKRMEEFKRKQERARQMREQRLQKFENEWKEQLHSQTSSASDSPGESQAGLTKGNSQMQGLSGVQQQQHKSASSYIETTKDMHRSSSSHRVGTQSMTMSGQFRGNQSGGAQPQYDNRKSSTAIPSSGSVISSDAFEDLLKLAHESNYIGAKDTGRGPKSDDYVGNSVGPGQPSNWDKRLQHGTLLSQSRPGAASILEKSDISTAFGELLAAGPMSQNAHSRLSAQPQMTVSSPMSGKTNSADRYSIPPDGSKNRAASFQVGSFPMGGNEGSTNRRGR